MTSIFRGHFFAPTGISDTGPLRAFARSVRSASDRQLSAASRSRAPPHLYSQLRRSVLIHACGVLSFVLHACDAIVHEAGSFASRWLRNILRNDSDFRDIFFLCPTIHQMQFAKITATFALATFSRGATFDHSRHFRTARHLSTAQVFQVLIA
jgi:hypothetical protein